MVRSSRPRLKNQIGDGYGIKTGWDIKHDSDWLLIPGDLIFISRYKKTRQ